MTPVDGLPRPRILIITTHMNAPTERPIRLTDLSHGGGCGCKIAPAVLSEILSRAPLRTMPKELLVGIETSDDAAVYRLNDNQAIVATTDFFTPIVDDPYDFGRIAAANAISDVYAMGAQPIFALAVVGMPLDKLPVDVIQRILAGGESVCAARICAYFRTPHNSCPLQSDVWCFRPDCYRWAVCPNRRSAAVPASA